MSKGTGIIVRAIRLALADEILIQLDPAFKKVRH